mmetsp:Transcript_14673/g.34795  ORF Transcript_14673/g.34795 Transcript_14673/m.34795 type:complete len:474 (+) Transcript_14673:209-1630(+)
MEPYRLHHPGVHAYERMDMHLPYERMRMQQHRMYHHAPPAVYPQFRPSPIEAIPQYEPRQTQLESSGDSEMMSSTTIEGKKRLIIFPRRKAGQRERDINNVAPVHLTLETIEDIADVPLLVAAKQLGISKTALKNACRHLGLERWPFRRRMQNARLQNKAAEKAASQLREAAAAATAADARGGATSYTVSQRNPQAPSSQGQRAQIVKEEEASTSDSSSDGKSRSTSSHRSEGAASSLSQPSERSSSSSDFYQDAERLGAFYSALTTPNASTVTSGDDQASPTNQRPPRRNPAGPRFDAVPDPSHFRAAAGPRCAPKHQLLQHQQQHLMAAQRAREERMRLEREEDWIDARVRGASPHLHGDDKFRSSPLLTGNIAEEVIQMPSQFALKMPHHEAAAHSAHSSSHVQQQQIERGMNNAVHPAEMPVREAKVELSTGLSNAEMSWVMEEEHSMWGEDVDCSYSLPVMYQPIGNC